MPLADAAAATAFAESVAAEAPANVKAEEPRASIPEELGVAFDCCC